MSMAIKCNMGTPDRIVRVIIGVSLVLFGVFGPVSGAWRAILPIVGLIPIITAIIGYCPAYQIFGLSGAKR